MTKDAIEIQGKILQILEEIKLLNNEYKNLGNDFDKFSNTKKIDELELQIYELENFLINDYDDANYFFLVLDYKKWLIKNGEYTDNIDFLNKKINLNILVNERIANVQSYDIRYNKQLLMINEQNRELERQEIEFQRANIEYEKQMEAYKQEMLKYENELSMAESQNDYYDEYNSNQNVDLDYPTNSNYNNYYN